jgi:hypothetical protein
MSGRDVLAELRQLAQWGDEHTDLDTPHTVDVIKAAIAEIEFLRSHAGAVTQGESFDDIAKRVGRQPRDEQAS